MFHIYVYLQTISAKKAPPQSFFAYFFGSVCSVVSCAAPRSGLNWTLIAFILLYPASPFARWIMNSC